MKKIEAYSYGCIMANLPKDVAARTMAYANLIPDDEIYDNGDEEHGREEMPHVTVKYGLHTDDGKEVKDKLSEQDEAFATLGEITAFDNEGTDYVVLKIDVSSDCLTRLNDFVSNNFDVTDSFPGYNPHVTLAYLKRKPDNPHYYRKYFGRLFDGTEINFKELLFSSADDKDTTIPLKVVNDKAASMATRIAMSSRIAKEWSDAL